MGRAGAGRPLGPWNRTQNGAGDVMVMKDGTLLVSDDHNGATRCRACATASAWAAPMPWARRWPA
jgi:hypothetical protein